uniref:Uncharacterized protein n=1 Tax=Pundamilia nyererei TaxID=303518 RepID=A0A3B4GE48_9CICH
MACGQDHSLAVSASGHVFSWGAGEDGQLGLPTPSNIAVTQIAAGGTHSLFLTLADLVYCCGANKCGQLGVNRVDEKGRASYPQAAIQSQCCVLYFCFFNDR